MLLITNLHVSPKVNASNLHYPYLSPCSSAPKVTFLRNKNKSGRCDRVGDTTLFSL